jgi:serine/threonine-protein kinase HipA
MIRIWTDGAEAGLLGRLRDRGSTFAYAPTAAPQRAVSVTMPLRLQSWDTAFGLAPIFEMNLPEGILRERIRLAFAKATGAFDEFDLLTIVGRSQVGRIRYTGRDDQLDEAVPFQSVDEILENRRGGDLYRYLLERFATFSGISGVQPKVLVRDQEDSRALNTTGRRVSPSYRGATHIVKFWDPTEFPHLAANEFFCLKVAEKCGLDVPRFRLSEDGMALVIDRFDLHPDGSYRGFEDFCVLNARRTDEKYRGSCETSLFKRLGQFVPLAKQAEESEKLFTLIALNCALRNGDAHLKNFGICYDEVEGKAQLAPVYDLVTTTVYMHADSMALTLNGTIHWPSAKDLQRLGETRASSSPARVGQILERIADAQSDIAPQITGYAKDHPDFASMGKQMVEEWQTGKTKSLGY